MHMDYNFCTSLIRAAISGRGAPATILDLYRALVIRAWPDTADSGGQGSNSGGCSGFGVDRGD